MSRAADAGPLFDLCRAALQSGLGMALESTLLLGSGLLAGWLLRRRGPALQSLLYRAALIGTIACGGLSLLLGPRLRFPWSIALPATAPHPTPQRLLDTWSGSVLQGERAGAGVMDARRLPPLLTPGARPGGIEPAAQRAARGGAVAEQAGAATAREPSSPVRPAAPEQPRIGWLYVFAVGIWAAGAALLLIRLLCGGWELARWRRRAAPIRSEALRGLLAELSHALSVAPPGLLAGAEITSPFLAGLRRPAILLPAECERQFDGPALRLIVAHELAHLARRDCEWNLLARLACAVGWAQPLLWVLRRRLDQTSEEACDQEVVRREGDPRAYARCLLALSEQLLPSMPEGALGVGVVTIRSSVGRRIQQILASARERPLPPSPHLRAVVAAAASAAIVAGLFLASAVAAPPGDRDSASRHVLRDVPELEKPVTFTETKIPLSELVQRVSADTGVTLKAAAEVADEPVAVVVQAMPARELLEQLADLLDYRWRRLPEHRTPNADPPTPAFEIWQDLAGKKREEALRNALSDDVIRRFQARLGRYVEMASWTPDRLRKFLEDAQRPTRANDPNANDRVYRGPIAWTMMSPISRSVAQLLGGLTPEQWEAVRDGKNLTFSTNPEPGELAMPAETEQVLRAARPTLYPPGEPVTWPDPSGSEQARRAEAGIQAQWAAATGFRVTIGIDLAAWREQNILQLTAAAKPFRAGAPPGADFFDAYEGTSVHIQTEPMEPLGWEKDPAQPPEAELARDPVLSEQQRFEPRAKPRHEWYEDPGTPALYRLRDLLPDLARTYHVQFISDAYTPVHGRVGARPSPEPEPLYRLLSQYANPTHRWDHRGRLIRLRSRTWYLDRPREIPLRLVRHWKALTDEHGALPLDTYLEITRTLTDLQLANLSNIGEDVDLPRSVTWYEIGRDRYALRLYAALSPEQRQALWDGKTLPAAQMTANQRALFLASLEERSRHGRPLKLASWRDAGFSLEAVPRTLTVERSAGSASTEPALGARTEPPGQPVAAPAPGSRPPDARSARNGRFPVTRLTLQLRCAPDQQDEITLLVAAPQ